MFAPPAQKKNKYYQKPVKPKLKKFERKKSFDIWLERSAQQKDKERVTKEVDARKQIKIERMQAEIQANQKNIVKKKQKDSDDDSIMHSSSSQSQINVREDEEEFPNNQYLNIDKTSDMNKSKDSFMSKRSRATSKRVRHSKAQHSTISVDSSESQEGSKHRSSRDLKPEDTIKSKLRIKNRRSSRESKQSLGRKVPISKHSSNTSIKQLISVKDSQSNNRILELENEDDPKDPAPPDKMRLTGEIRVDSSYSKSNKTKLMIPATASQKVNETSVKDSIKENDQEVFKSSDHIKSQQSDIGTPKQILSPRKLKQQQLEGEKAKNSSPSSKRHGNMSPEKRSNKNGTTSPSRIAALQLTNQGFAEMANEDDYQDTILRHTNSKPQSLNQISPKKLLTMEMVNQQMQEFFNRDELLDEVEEMIEKSLEDAEEGIYNSIQELNEALSTTIREKVNQAVHELKTHISKETKHTHEEIKRATHKLEKDRSALEKKLDSAVIDLAKSDKFNCKPTSFEFINNL